MRLPVIHGVISLGVYLVLDFILLMFTPLGVYSLVIGNMVFPLVISALNWRTLRKEFSYVQEMDRTFLRTGLCTAFMAILALLLYRGMLFITKSNAVSLLTAIGLAAIIYFVMLVVFRAVEEEELLDMPKGTLLVRIAKKFRLL